MCFSVLPRPFYTSTTSSPQPARCQRHPPTFPGDSGSHLCKSNRAKAQARPNSSPCKIVNKIPGNFGQGQLDGRSHKESSLASWPWAASFHDTNPEPRPPESNPCHPHGAASSAALRVGFFQQEHLFSLLVGSCSSFQRLFDHIWWIWLLKKALWRRDSGDFDPSSLCAAVTYVVNKHEGNYTNRNSGNPARREGTANPLCTKKKKLKKTSSQSPSQPQISSIS